MSNMIPHLYKFAISLLPENVSYIFWRSAETMKRLLLLCSSNITPSSWLHNCVSSLDILTLVNKLVGSADLKTYSNVGVANSSSVD